MSTFSIKARSLHALLSVLARDYCLRKCQDTRIENAKKYESTCFCLPTLCRDTPDSPPGRVQKQVFVHGRAVGWGGPPPVLEIVSEGGGGVAGKIRSYVACARGMIVSPKVVRARGGCSLTHDTHTHAHTHTHANTSRERQRERN